MPDDSCIRSVIQNIMCICLHLLYTYCVFLLVFLLYIVSQEHYEDMVEVTSSNSGLNETVVCHDDFMLINSTCYPRCDRFEELPHNTIKAIVGVEAAASVIGLTLSVAALVISVWNRENM